MQARVDLVAPWPVEAAPVVVRQCRSARRMTEIARKTNLGRQSLYKSLSPDGRPEFATVLTVVRALGLKLTVSVA